MIGIDRSVADVNAWVATVVGMLVQRFLKTSLDGNVCVSIPLGVS
jgi:hypothetical protein